MTKHTPGPWIVEEMSSEHTDDGNAITAICAYADEDGKDGSIVAEVNRWAWEDNPATPESNANARLIAAAPDLLEALRELHDFSVPDEHFRKHERSKAAFDKAAELLNRLGG